MIADASEQDEAAAAAEYGGQFRSDVEQLLSVRLAGRNVELPCPCGFTLTQPLRATIEPQSPKCRRRWRR